MTGGLSIDWFVENINAVGPTLFGATTGLADVISKLESQAAHSAPAGILFHPFMASAGERAPFVDSFARAQLIGLSQSTSFAEVLRAIYEGVGFAARDCYEEMDRLPRKVHASGGASKSPLMVSILASTLGTPVAVLSKIEAGARGAALIAGLSAGAFSNLIDEAKKWRSVLHTVEHAPDPALQAVYAQAFLIYRKSYQNMHETWRALAAWRAQDG